MHLTQKQMRIVVMNTLTAIFQKINTHLELMVTHITAAHMDRKTFIKVKRIKIQGKVIGVNQILKKQAR